MSRSRRAKRSKRPAQAAEPGPRHPNPATPDVRRRPARSRRQMLTTLAPLLALLALFIFLSTGPEPSAIRNVFGVFFLGWGAILIALGGRRLTKPALAATAPPELRSAEKIRTYMYLGAGMAFGVLGALILTGAINLSFGRGA